MSKNTIDLFSGCGGFSKGFEKAGFNMIAGVDKDKKSIETWEDNHDGLGLVRDLTNIDQETLEEDLPVSKREIDIIIGGPPCQDFTKCNRKIDLGRNNLVLLFSEYIKYFEPDIFVMENVRQLETRYENIMEKLKEKLCDYKISHRILNTVDYGVPQHRIRTIVIGYNNKSKKPKFPKPLYGEKSEENKHLKKPKEAFERYDTNYNGEDIYRCTGDYGDLLEDIPPGMNYSFYTDKYEHPDPKYEWRSKFSDFLYKADPYRPIRALKAKPGGGTGPFHWDNRRFTEEELKALHTFPEEFEFNCRYTTVVKQVGNSVPPKFSKILAYTVLKDNPNYDYNKIDLNLVDQTKNLDIISRKRTPSEVYKKKARKKIKDLK